MKELKPKEAREEIKDPMGSCVKLSVMKELLAMAEADGAKDFYLMCDKTDPNEYIWATWAGRSSTTGRRKERWFKLGIHEGFTLYRIDKYD